MEDTWRWDEDEELLAAIADADRGEGVVVTDFRDYLDGLSRRARESADDEVRDDVKY